MSFCYDTLQLLLRQICFPWMWRIRSLTWLGRRGGGVYLYALQMFGLERSEYEWFARIARRSFGGPPHWRSEGPDPQISSLDLIWSIHMANFADIYHSRESSGWSAGFGGLCAVWTHDLVHCFHYMQKYLIFSQDLWQMRNGKDRREGQAHTIALIHVSFCEIIYILLWEDFEKEKK